MFLSIFNADIPLGNSLYRLEYCNATIPPLPRYRTPYLGTITYRT